MKKEGKVKVQKAAKKAVKKATGVGKIEDLDSWTSPAAAKIFQEFGRKNGLSLTIDEIRYYFRYGLKKKSPLVVQEFDKLVQKVMETIDPPAAAPPQGADRRDRSLPLEELRKLYYDDKNYFGRDKLWKIAHAKGINVSRRDVMNWLKTQNLNQVYSYTKKTKDVAPTTLKHPRQQLGIDLIDFRNFAFEGFDWILTGMDLFSKKMYAEPMKGKETDEAYRAIQALLKSVSPAAPLFSIVRSDNGSEFKGALNRLAENVKASPKQTTKKKTKRRGAGPPDWLTKNYGRRMETFSIKKKKNAKSGDMESTVVFTSSSKFKWVFSLAYKPWSNGGVERANGTLKRLIFKSMKGGQVKATKASATETRDWVTSLPQLVSNYNNAVHDVTKMTPNDLDKVPRDGAGSRPTIKGKRTPQVTVQKEIESKATRGTKGAVGAANLKKGQLVRVKKDEEDQKSTADINTLWSDAVYRITSVRKKKTETSMFATRYKVENVKTGKPPPTRANEFYRNDLQPITSVANKIEASDVWEISKLSDPHVADGVKMFMVQWKYQRGLKNRTQESRKRLLQDAPKIVAAFEKKNNVNWRKVPTKAPQYAVLTTDTPAQEQDTSTPVKVLTRVGRKGKAVKPGDIRAGQYVVLWSDDEITSEPTAWAKTFPAVVKTYVASIKPDTPGKALALKRRRWQFKQQTIVTSDGKGGRLKYEARFGPVDAWIKKQNTWLKAKGSPDRVISYPS